jgi:hypothetical protein
LWDDLSVAGIGNKDNSLLMKTDWATKLLSITLLKRDTDKRYESNRKDHFFVIFKSDLASWWHELVAL